MAAFIVISTINRLHYLVDGIEKCRPLNPDVSLSMSTGKIIKDDDEYTYEYMISGERLTSNDEKKALNDMLSNQIASFRKAFSIPKDTMVNVFLLENPLTEDEYEETLYWNKEFDKIYLQGKGYDVSFRLIRVLFSYDITCPTNIRKQAEISVLRKLFIEQSQCGLNSFLFYIDNQDCNSAALCLNKEEHDVKIPRILMDFMILVSNDNDSYGVINSIQSVEENTKCFSVGYAESMYYYDDVERYFEHADKRDLYNEFLNGEGRDAEDTMDIESFPFGLRKRADRLGEIYEDIPFNQDIESYSNAADKQIDECVKLLRNIIEKKREQELAEFMQSEIVQNLERSIETNEDSVTLEKELDNLINNYKYECPNYIDREEIYKKLEDIDPEFMDDYISCKENEYKHLLKFIRSHTFWDYVVSNKEKQDQGQAIEKDNQPSIENIVKNEGCLYKLMFWRKRHSTIIENKAVQDKNGSKPDKTEDEINGVESLKKIKKLLKQKEGYKRFISHIDRLNAVLLEENRYCGNFKLTNHTNHYFLLVNLPKLREEQEKESVKRREMAIRKWAEKDNRSVLGLELCMKAISKDFVRNSFPFLNWDSLFPFVKSVEEKHPEICNNLQKKSAPFVNYNRTLDFAENSIKLVLYSDRPKFEDEIKNICGKLNNGNAITAYHSSHIVSKICMMQFLPIDKSIIENLVDLQDEI